MNVAGIDEVGRGCWAGPLVAGAVVMTKHLEGLRDSKLLSAKQRERLATQIYASGASVGLGWVWPQDIDAWGLTKAIAVAMRRALGQVTGYDEVIIDGNVNFLPDVVDARPLVRADQIVPAASAASIVAKVARDTYMQFISEQYPHYGFDAHVGYGTEMHRRMLALHGPCSLHRYSFRPIKRASKS